MKRKRKIITVTVISLLLLGTLCLTLGLCIQSSNGPLFTGEAAKYRDTLMAQGFPEDYANALTSLHLLHPSWEFVPLRITQYNSTYTWNYIIKQETKNPQTNLIPPEADYRAYRHPTNLQTYDSGFYQASEKAVEYFMDPRNFLNEADIFQFYDLRSTGTTSADAVDAVLKNTFMENTKLENGMTYTDYLLKLEKELGIDPVYLAVKLRQEQGTAGTSPIISGTCGSLLLSYYKNQTQYTDSGKKINPPKTGESEQALLALNNHYNPLNLNATGNGIYEIYKNAMEYAVAGTSSMQSAWGSPSWNTMWKGIYGGALKIRDRYINRYQSTVYLQKFNIDPRAGTSVNFTSQYMQNIAGAFTEGRSLYQSFAANDTLDAPCQFLIPIYEDMPSKPSPDPANGNCTLYKPASDRYETTVSLSLPKDGSAENETLFLSAECAYNQSLSLRGTFTHSYGMKGLEYAWDGGEWVSCSQSGTLNLSLPCDKLTYGEHILVIRGEAAYDHSVSGRKQNRYFLGAVISLTVLPPPSANITFQSGSSTTTEKHYEGATLTLPLSDDPDFTGWLGSDGSFLPAGEAVTVRQDTFYTAILFDLQTIEGASVLLDSPSNLRFYATASEADLQNARQKLPQNSLCIMARLTCNNSVNAPVPVEVWEEVALFSDQSLRRKLTVDTPLLIENEKNALWSAEFFLDVTYTNGKTGYIPASGTTAVRSATQIAYEALADKQTPYSEQERLTLQQIVT